MTPLVTSLPAVRIPGLGIWRYTIESREVVWSDELFRILGRNPVLGSFNLADPNPYLMADQRVMLVALSQRCVLERVTAQGVLEFVRENQQRIKTLMTIHPILNDSGDLIALEGTVQDISFWVQAPVGMLSDSNYYLNLINHLEEVVFSIDQAGFGVFINPAWERLTGRSLAYFISVPFIEYVFDDDRQRMLEALEALRINQHQTVRLEMRILNHKGIPVWVECHARNGFHSSSEGFISGTLMNINDRKSQETQLRNQRLAIENALEGIAVMNGNDEYVYLNKAHVELFGYTDESELLGKSWTIFYDEQEIERISREVFPPFIRDGVIRCETKGKKRDGTPIFQDICLTALPDGGLICITHDITERKAQEEKMKELALVTSRTNMVVMISDCEGRITWVNESFSQKTGFSSEEIVGRYPHEVLRSNESNPGLVDEIYACLSAGKPYQGEIKSFSKWGEPIWFHIDITPVYDAEGRLSKFFAVESDITEKKIAEENILHALEKERELSELKTQFIHLASHEFRTPMASIQTSMDVLRHYMQSHIHEEDPGRKLFDRHHLRIRSEIYRVTEIMNNILLMGRIDAGKMVYTPVATRPDELLQSLIEEEQMLYPSLDIHLEVQGAPEPYELDPGSVSHIFKNLFTNALKYGKTGDSPRVKVEFLTHCFRLMVSDRGIGIPAAEQGQLFQSFFRASNAENIQGTGLGLVIIKKLTEMHGGTVSVDSTMNEGTCFTIEIPKHQNQ